ncbi:MAG: CoA pyrophosphatase [Alphaproteobacteria bacterium]|nr:CoA pyrophosphatase [Alphaproteobacteria bacterium]
MNLKQSIIERLVPVNGTAGVIRGSTRGDWDLNPDVRGLLRERFPSFKPAAVLVPIVEHASGATVLLTQRTAHLADHAGQISFPGGRVEPVDRDAVETALRETEEEIGLTRDFVDVAGRLDTYETGTGFSITPVVGVVRPGFVIAPDSFEVAEVFEVPLAFVLDPANHQRGTREFRGVERKFYVLPYESRYIWGATAGMLVNLAHRLRGAPA